MRNRAGVDLPLTRGPSSCGSANGIGCTPTVPPMHRLTRMLDSRLAVPDDARLALDWRALRRDFSLSGGVASPQLEPNVSRLGEVLGRQP